VEIIKDDRANPPRLRILLELPLHQTLRADHYPRHARDLLDIVLDLERDHLVIPVSLFGSGWAGSCRRAVLVFGRAYNCLISDELEV
jgi:hypothetical protein